MRHVCVLHDDYGWYWNIRNNNIIELEAEMMEYGININMGVTKFMWTNNREIVNVVTKEENID